MRIKRAALAVVSTGMFCLLPSALYAAQQASPAGAASPNRTTVAVPEPITASLVGLAAAGVGYALFNRRKRSRAK